MASERPAIAGASERQVMRRGGTIPKRNRIGHKIHKDHRKAGSGFLQLFSCLFVFFVAIFPCLAQQPAASRMILLDGSAISFASLEISGGKLRSEGVPADLTLDDLRRIEVSVPPATAASNPAVVAELRGGGRILAKSATISDDECQLAWSVSDESLNLALDLLRALRLEPATASAEFDNALATPSAELDRVFVKDEVGKLSSVTGLIESLTGDELTLEVGGQMHKVPRSKLFGIIVAQPSASTTTPRCLVTLSDGSLLGGEELSLSDGQADLVFSGGGKATIPWAAIRQVAIRSRRVAFLSDLKPIDDQQQPIVTLPRPWQRDRAVTGEPLMLGGRSYEKGIGVHSRSQLTFAAEKKWDTLGATIGLDGVSGSKGDCVFIVLADGQPLVSRRMKGSDSPEEISVTISGREHVTLLVEPGEGLDLADHANWGDVRFIKNRE